MFVVVKDKIFTNKGVIKVGEHRLGPKVTSNVLATVSTKVFHEIWAHSKETHNLETGDNHVFKVLKDACKIFCSVILISDRLRLRDHSLLTST